MDQVRGDSQDAGPSQVKCEQTNESTRVDNLDLLSVNSNYSDEEDCQMRLMGKEILNSMMANIKNEDVYLDQFTQLLQLEDYFKTGNNPSLSKVSIDVYNPSTVRYTVGKQELVNDYKPSFVCEKEERILKRQEIFHNPTFNVSVHKSYDAFLDRLIDLEESFTAQN